MHRSRVVVGVRLGVVIAVAGWASGIRAEDRVLMSIPRYGTEGSHRVVSVEAAKRTLRIEPDERYRDLPASEGPAILVMGPRDGAPPDRAIRVEVTEVFDDGSVRATFGPGAVGTVTEGAAFLGRP